MINRAHMKRQVSNLEKNLSVKAKQTEIGHIRKAEQTNLQSNTQFKYRAIVVKQEGHVQQNSSHYKKSWARDPNH
jgi:hypothetical protein